MRTVTESCPLVNCLRFNDSRDSDIAHTKPSPREGDVEEKRQTREKTKHQNSNPASAPTASTAGPNSTINQICGTHCNESYTVPSTFAHADKTTCYIIDRLQRYRLGLLSNSPDMHIWRKSHRPLQPSARQFYYGR